MKAALLIGINDYPNGNELSGCVADIKSLKKAIERNGDGTKNFDVKLMPDVQTSGEVMREIKKLFAGEADTVLLYFSGHGFVNTVGAEIVMPQDMLIEGQYYMGIQMNTIMALVNQSKAKYKIIILDCCHSGHMGNYQLDESVCALNTGVSILTACREDEYALEKGGHGIFTELLCDALNGGAADFLGNITIGGIYAYIDRSLGAFDQRPIFRTNIKEFSPIKKVTPLVNLDYIRQITKLFSKPDMEFQLDPSFEFTNVLAEKHKHEVIEPYANKDNVQKFKVLQKLQSIGVVRPVGEEYMYFAAMNSKTCKLTNLGKYYWRLVHDGRI
jgi:hypothetical protein